MRRPLLIIALLLACAGIALLGQSTGPKPPLSPLASPSLNGWIKYRGPTTTLPPTTVLRTSTTHTSRGRVQARSQASGNGLWDCIAEKESGNGRGSANIYQFLPSTWSSAAKENNSPYPTAASAPPAEQRRVAQAWAAKHGVRNQWTTAARCGA